MNREIKFRAWVKPTGIFKGEPYMAIQGTPDIESLQSFMHHYSDEELLMQFTGMKDKDGVDIYEGDILHCHEYDSSDTGKRIVQTFKNAVVGFADGNYYYYPKGNMRMAHQLLMYAYQPKVIGNIYQNPELIPQS